MTGYYLLLIQFLFALAALFLFWQGVTYFRTMWQFKKLKAMPLPSTYRSILQNIHLYQSLSTHYKEKLHLLILLFVDQKEFVGAKGFAITDEVKIIIAFYSSLMRLGFQIGEKDKASTIIVYPEHFVVDVSHTSEGIHHTQASLLEGQSANGTVVISWQDIIHHITHPEKENVIIHEFAHELDFEDGVADGTPALSYSNYRQYSEVFSHAFHTLHTLAKTQKITEGLRLIGSYALNHEAEFFAVCSERFFLTPQELKKHLPQVYEELQAFYRLDTIDLYPKKAA
jgi:Mlc titration factor MtfA (ptsG expression regulator)